MLPAIPAPSSSSSSSSSKVAARLRFATSATPTTPSLPTIPGQIAARSPPEQPRLLVRTAPASYRALEPLFLDRPRTAPFGFKFENGSAKDSAAPEGDRLHRATSQLQSRWATTSHPASPRPLRQLTPPPFSSGSSLSSFASFARSGSAGSTGIGTGSAALVLNAVQTEPVAAALPASVGNALAAQERTRTIVAEVGGPAPVSGAAAASLLLPVTAARNDDGLELLANANAELPGEPAPQATPRQPPAPYLLASPPHAAATATRSMAAEAALPPRTRDEPQQQEPAAKAAAAFPTRRRRRNRLLAWESDAEGITLCTSRSQVRVAGGVGLRSSYLDFKRR